MKNNIEAVITPNIKSDNPSDYLYNVKEKHPVVSVEITNGDYTWQRKLVGFRTDMETSMALKNKLNVDLLREIARTNWENHYDEETDHYMTDMESRLFIEKSEWKELGWQSTSFELEDAEIEFVLGKWFINNRDLKQLIVLDTWTKDRPFLKWVYNYYRG